MNDLYFACMDCKVYLDAGYRWCYWHLQHPGIVRIGEKVDVDRVLACESYWNSPKEPSSDWLYNKVFPSVRSFLNSHRNHHIIFSEFELIPPFEETLDWLMVGFCPRPLPRFLIEELNLKSWDEVVAWNERQEEGLRLEDWTNGTEEMEPFRQAFEKHLRKRTELDISS